MFARVITNLSTMSNLSNIDEMIHRSHETDNVFMQYVKSLRLDQNKQISEDLEKSIYVFLKGSDN